MAMIRSAYIALVIAALAATQPASAQDGRSVALVLDASGSMNAKLPDGQTRIDAAKAAVADLVAKMDAGTRLALRVYGHQSATQARDCKDTARIVDFDSVSANKGQVAAKVKEIKARGYTPITYSLTLAAQDLTKEEGERVVVLVSDGQETCEADPCVAAKALAAADAKLAIHTIGFGVSAAARSQLQCIASVARGTYFDAASAGDLASTLGKAAKAKAVQTKESGVAVKAAGARSNLVIKNTTAGAAHAVTAEDGREVMAINGAVGRAELAPGIYSVHFANGPWRGVQVKPGETTTLELGILKIEGGQNDIAGYTLLEPETEQAIVKDKVIGMMPLMPARIVISSGHLRWPEIEIKAGETTILNPARLSVKGDKAGTYSVSTDDGRVAGKVSRLFNLPLPPGKYVVELEGQKLAVELKEGETRSITVD
jgi:hypothetical protein